MKTFGKVTAETKAKNFGAPFDGLKQTESNIMYQLATNPVPVQKIQHAG